MKCSRRNDVLTSRPIIAQTLSLLSSLSNPPWWSKVGWIWHHVHAAVCWNVVPSELKAFFSKAVLLPVFRLVAMSQAGRVDVTLQHFQNNSTQC